MCANDRHFSSPRTKMRLAERGRRDTGKVEQVQAPPVWTGRTDNLKPLAIGGSGRVLPSPNPSPGAQMGRVERR
jgi:hypothetical protein